MQQFFEFPVNALCTFDSFVACDGNAGALEFSRRIADPDDSENLLYLYGPSGSGKTHLLKAIGQVMGCPYLTCREPFTADSLFGRFASAEALIVDDLQLLPDDAGLRAALWQIFNDFHLSGRKIVMAGLLPPRELPYLDDHLISRLLWGLVARVDVSDDHSRQMILRKIAVDRQVRIPDDVVDYILMTTCREVGDLINAFEALYRLSMASKRRITLPLAREAQVKVEVHSV
ncbi:MAG: DnaA regulatory inactivator Hda [Desulfuromonadales bacterium]|nr:DnaA regulatory inactivator Hda [Desulfuromonadales bacterium]